MITCTINGKKRSFDIDPVKRLRDMLLMNGSLWSKRIMRSTKGYVLLWGIHRFLIQV